VPVPVPVPVPVLVPLSVLASVSVSVPQSLSSALSLSVLLSSSDCEESLPSSSASLSEAVNASANNRSRIRAKLMASSSDSTPVTSALVWRLDAVVVVGVVVGSDVVEGKVIEIHFRFPLQDGRAEAYWPAPLGVFFSMRSFWPSLVRWECQQGHSSRR
jgi:hypothetical protein